MTDFFSIRSRTVKISAWYKNSQSFFFKFGCDSEIGLNTVYTGSQIIIFIFIIRWKHLSLSTINSIASTSSISTLFYAMFIIYTSSFNLCYAIYHLYRHLYNHHQIIDIDIYDKCSSIHVKYYAFYFSYIYITKIKSFFFKIGVIIEIWLNTAYKDIQITYFNHYIRRMLQHPRIFYAMRLPKLSDCGKR